MGNQFGQINDLFWDHWLRFYLEFDEYHCHTQKIAYRAVEWLIYDLTRITRLSIKGN